MSQSSPPHPSLPQPQMGLCLPAVPPVIENGLPDLSTMEGSQALLPCTAKGSPEPAITWEKDGQLVSVADGKFTLQPSGELLVKNSEVSVALGWQRSVEYHLFAKIIPEPC